MNEIIRSYHNECESTYQILKFNIKTTKSILKTENQIMYLIIEEKQSIKIYELRYNTIPYVDNPDPIEYCCQHARNQAEA